MTPEQFNKLVDLLNAIQIFQFFTMIQLAGIIIFCAITAAHTKR